MSSYPSRVYVNGYYRQSGETADDFTVQLPNAIIKPKQMSINSASIPFLCYTFGESESIFYFQAGSNVVRQITLNLTKNYTSISQFITDFQAQLQVLVPTITVTQNLTNNDGILTISCPTGINIVGIEQKEYNWDATYYNNCSDRLGFYNANFKPLLTTPTATAFKASAPMTLIRTTAIYVGIDCIAGDSYTSNSPSQCVSNILFMLPTQNGTFGAIQNYTNNDFMLFTGSDLPSAVYNIHVTLYDDNFNNLGLLPSAKVQIELSWKYDDAPSLTQKMGIIH
jgi:hypothetical protein